MYPVSSLKPPNPPNQKGVLKIFPGSPSRYMKRALPQHYYGRAFLLESFEHIRNVSVNSQFLQLFFPESFPAFGIRVHKPASQFSEQYLLLGSVCKVQQFSSSSS